MEISPKAGQEGRHEACTCTRTELLHWRTGTASRSIGPAAWAVSRSRFRRVLVPVQVVVPVNTSDAKKDCRASGLVCGIPRKSDDHGPFSGQFFSLPFDLGIFSEEKSGQCRGRKNDRYEEEKRKKRRQPQKKKGLTKRVAGESCGVLDRYLQTAGKVRALPQQDALRSRIGR